jgi:hypothetical protein
MGPGGRQGETDTETRAPSSLCLLAAVRWASLFHYELWHGALPCQSPKHNRAGELRIETSATWAKKNLPSLISYVGSFPPSETQPCEEGMNQNLLGKLDPWLPSSPLSQDTPPGQKRQGIPHLDSISSSWLMVKSHSVRQNQHSYQLWEELWRCEW